MRLDHVTYGIVHFNLLAIDLLSYIWRNKRQEWNLFWLWWLWLHSY